MKKSWDANKQMGWGSWLLAMGLIFVFCSSNAIADCHDAAVSCATKCGKGNDIGTIKVGTCLKYDPLPHCYVCHDKQEDRVKWVQDCHDKFAPDRDLKDIYTCYQPYPWRSSTVYCNDSEGKSCGQYGAE